MSTDDLVLVAQGTRDEAFCSFSKTPKWKIENALK
jgi:hypothetical protein